MVQPIEYIPRQHRLGLGAQATSKEQLKQMMDDKGKPDRRMLAVTENYQASSVGRNYKTIDEKLQTVKKMGVGSKVDIVSGLHKGLSGKIVALSKQSGSESFGMGADGNQLEPETYVSVELKPNNTVVQVKAKRIQMKQKVTSRSRSRSGSPSKRSETDVKVHH